MSPEDGIDPEQEALLGDSVGLAMLVVLDSLTPAERVAFVLHDVFAVPFDEIAPIVGRTPTAARQLASRARRRVQGAPVPDVDLDGQWAVVDAFLAAARDGDFERLLAVLDPDVVLRSDGGAARPELVSLVRGAQAVAEQAMTFRRFAETATRVLVNGIPGGVAWAPDGSPFAVLALTVRGGQDRRDRRPRRSRPARASWISPWSPAERPICRRRSRSRRLAGPLCDPRTISHEGAIDMTVQARTGRRALHGGSRCSARSPSRCWPPAFRSASTGSSRSAAGRAVCRGRRPWRSSGRRPALGLGPVGRRPLGAQPARRRTRDDHGARPGGGR